MTSWRWAAGILLSIASAQAASASERDPWLGPDKALHFGATTAISLGGYGAACLFTDNRWVRASTGFGLAVTVGAAKEGYDALGHGDPSWRDFTWDVVGAAVGTGLAFMLDRYVFSHRTAAELRAQRTHPWSATLLALQ